MHVVSVARGLQFRLCVCLEMSPCISEHTSRRVFTWEKCFAFCLLLLLLLLIFVFFFCSPIQCFVCTFCYDFICISFLPIILFVYSFFLPFIFQLLLLLCKVNANCLSCFFLLLVKKWKKKKNGIKTGSFCWE